MTLSDSELTELYDRYAHVVFHRCLRILKNEEEAHDATHEVFSRVIRHGERFRGDASPMTFMYKIATNYCLNQLRNKHGRADKLHVHREDIVGDGFVAPHDKDRFDVELVRAMLDEVDEQTRQVVLYTFFDDCTRQQVSDLVGISVPTVRKRLNQFIERARRRLGVSLSAVAALLTAASAAWLLGGTA